MNDPMKDLKHSIETLSNQLGDHIKSFDAHKLEQTKSNEKISGEYMQIKLSNAALKKDIQPMVEIFNNLKWGNKVLVKLGILLGGTVALIGGILTIIKIWVSFHLINK